MTLPLLLLFLLPQYHSDFCDAHHPAKDAHGIHAVDLCNFSYPGIKSRKHIGWPNPVIRLKNGVRPPEEEGGGGLIELEEIQYADLTHSGHDDALVTLLWHSGGTMHREIVYVLSMKVPKPVVVWDFAAGDRGYGGLHRVYGKDGDLVLEVNDPNAAAGNCCSLRIIRRQFRWNGSEFVQQGKSQVLPNPDHKE